VATLHLIVGLPGSGKTTLAKQLEQPHSALRLTPDEWVTRLFGTEVREAADTSRDTIEALLWQIAIRVLSLGVDVVLDFGCWARVEREMFRAEAASVRARSALYFLDVPLDELLSRIETRNAQLAADTFRIDPALIKLWAETMFQAPGVEELRPRDSRGFPESRT
jgi:predicted kinase